MDDATAKAPGSSLQHLAALLLSILPLLYLSVNFFNAWFHPLAPRNLPWIHDASLLIWLEFILAHAGIFALAFFSGGIHWRTVPGMLLFVCFYGMFIVGFSLAFDRVGMIVAMAVLLFSRLYSAAFAKHSSQDMLILRSFLTMGTIMACLFLCTTVIHGWNMKTDIAVAKLLGWKRNSFYGQAVAACSLYFLALALLELKLFFFPPRSIRAAAEAQS